ncbi:response regulator [bacterium]|nr:response regulator [bacterium]
MAETLTCLVIDDDDCILRLMHRMLEKIGFSVDCCNTWESGMECFYRESYELAILDIHMPGRDGFQLAQEMRQKKPEQKILIITGLGAGEVYRHLTASENTDFNDILYKPFSFDKIKSVIGAVLNIRL